MRIVAILFSGLLVFNQTSDPTGGAAPVIEERSQAPLKLGKMVLSRVPTKQFAQSNGHGRPAGGDTPRASIGGLYIESSKSESPEDLKKELLDVAESEGLKFGLGITSLQNRAAGGPTGFGGRGGGFGRGGGGGSARVIGDPISIYKV